MRNSPPLPTRDPHPILRQRQPFYQPKWTRNNDIKAEHRAIFDFYRELIRPRKEWSPPVRLNRENMQIVACEEEEVLAVIRSAGGSRTLCLFNFSDQSRVIRPLLTCGTWRVLLDSMGNSPAGSCVIVNSARSETFPTLAPFGVVVYQKE